MPSLSMLSAWKALFAKYAATGLITMLVPQMVSEKEFVKNIASEISIKDIVRYCYNGCSILLQLDDIDKDGNRTYNASADSLCIIFETTKWREENSLDELFNEALIIFGENESYVHSLNVHASSLLNIFVVNPHNIRVKIRELRMLSTDPRLRTKYGNKTCVVSKRVKLLFNPVFDSFIADASGFR